MKQRIISSAIGLVVLFLVLVLFETAVLNVAIMLIALIAENTKATAEKSRFAFQHPVAASSS